MTVLVDVVVVSVLVVGCEVFVVVVVRLFVVVVVFGVMFTLTFISMKISSTRVVVVLEVFVRLLDVVVEVDVEVVDVVGGARVVNVVEVDVVLVVVVCVIGQREICQAPSPTKKVL